MVMPVDGRDASGIYRRCKLYEITRFETSNLKVIHFLDYVSKYQTTDTVKNIKISQETKTRVRKFLETSIVKSPP